MKNKSEIIFKEKPGWIKLKKAKGTNFLFAERRGVDSVSVVLVDKESGSFGLINEAKPPFNERIHPDESGKMAFKISALGGSLFDAGHNRKEWVHAMEESERIEIARKVAANETREESGYTPIDVLYVGKTFSNSMSNEYVYLFIVVVDKNEEQKPDPQTPTEALANMVWFNKDEHLSNASLKDEQGAICGKFIQTLGLMYSSKEVITNKNMMSILINAQADMFDNLEKKLEDKLQKLEDEQKKLINQKELISGDNAEEHI